MSDTTQTFQLTDAQLESVTQQDDSITLNFSKIHLIQEMEGAIEDSFWTQAVTLKINGTETIGDLPDCPCELKGGDMTNNIYTYRNHAPLPINWDGDVSIKLIIKDIDTPCTIIGTAMQLEQIGHPVYIKHMKKQL